jgi:hypothetical protein
MGCTFWPVRIVASLVCCSQWRARVCLLGLLNLRALPLGRAGELASRVGLRACEPGGAGKQNDRVSGARKSVNDPLGAFAFAGV